MFDVVKKDVHQGDLIILANDEVTLHLSQYGCTLMKLFVKDRRGIKRDIVLGLESITDYQKKGGAYLGAIVGRTANRIDRARFTLNGRMYQLPVNNGPNSLHGGIEGFSYKMFDYIAENDRVIFRYHSGDGEEGYPGNLNVEITYQLIASGFKILYRACCDQDTIVNLTSHSYFNLNGTPSSITDHILQIHASQYGCVDENGLYNGQMRDVTGTPFDFRQPACIGKHLSLTDEQLQMGHGFDHPFLFDRNDSQVILYAPKSGIEMTVSTTLPLAQIYTANFLDEKRGKNGCALRARDGLCIETQYLPDSINKEKNSPVILEKGDVYDEETSYRFRTK